MKCRIGGFVAVMLASLAAGSPALAASGAGNGQQAGVQRAQRTADKALRTANAVSRSVQSLTKNVQSLAKVVRRLASNFTAIRTDVNRYGMITPEIGVVTLFAGNGPPSPGSSPTPLSPIGTIFSGQIPRGGNNGADANGTILYNCTGPAANPSAGCDLRLRAAVRTTRHVSGVAGSVGGGFVIIGVRTTGSNDATGAYAGAETGNGSAIARDPVGTVGFKSATPSNGTGTVVKFTPGYGHLVGIEGDRVTVHLQNPGLYEITGTLQFYDSKAK